MTYSISHPGPVDRAICRREAYPWTNRNLAGTKYTKQREASAKTPKIGLESIRMEIFGSTMEPEEAFLQDIAMIENYFGTSLRIFHENLSPEELSTLLKRSSDWSGEKGSPRSVGGMPGSLATWASNYWCADFAKGEEVDIQLARLAEFLSARENVISQILASGGRADVYLFVAPGKSIGIELAPELLHLLGRMGASIGIEFSVDAKERSPG